MPYQGNSTTGNQYYVHPGQDFGTGLTGLGKGLRGLAGEFQRNEQMKFERDAQIKEEEKANRIVESRQMATAAMESGDYAGLRKIVAANPSLIKDYDKMIGWQSDITKKNAIDFVTKAQQTEDPKEWDKLLTERIELVDQNGGDSAQTREIQNELRNGNIGPLVREAAALEAFYDIKPEGGDAKSQVKTYSKKNSDGSTRTIKNVKPGSEQEAKLLDSGFVQGTQTVGAKKTAVERQAEQLLKNVDNIKAKIAEIGPNEFSEKYSWRQEDDGSLFLDLSGMPQKLARFDKGIGKRGTVKAIKLLGEQWDDANELKELLMLPSVKKNLKMANEAGLWNEKDGKWNVGSKISNNVNKWLADKGVLGDSPTATAIARIQRMASDARKLYMGTAVTDTELKSATAWMPSAGDSYESMINKTNLVGHEAEQEFIRWTDLYSKNYDMSPFLKAFGIERFPEKDMPPEGVTEEEIQFTMDKHGVSREEVLSRIGDK